MKFYYNLCSVEIETTDLKSGGSGEHYKAGKSTLALKPKTTISSNRDRRVSVQGCVTLADERQNLETLIHIKMTLEQTLQQLNELNAVYNSGSMARETYLKKHKAISNKYKKANRPMTYNERIRSEGIKIKKNFKGWYTFIGKNFKVDLQEDSCETTWWEVCIWEDNVDARVFEHFDGYNMWDTKAEVVGALYELDKRLTDES